MKTLNKIRRSIFFGAVLLPALSFSSPLKPQITIWKSPSCGCCKDWEIYLQKNGFNVKAIPEGNDQIRKKLGMPIRYGSCHTALINGYVIEGHVPAREIKRLLIEKPIALGLAVPAMPIGSPGMDGPEYGGKKNPYDVLLIGMNGQSSVYQTYK